MDETLERARERYAPRELPAALLCLHEAGRLGHYWPALETLLERKSPPPVAAREALLRAIAAHECKGHDCCPEAAPASDELPEFIVFFSHAIGDEPESPQRPVAATCCVCAQVRAKGSDDWYPRVLAEPLLAENMLFSHGMCFDCARAYELELAI